MPPHSSSEPRRSPDGSDHAPSFYGWRIVGLTFFAQFLSMGTFFYTFGVFLKPLSEALGTDRFHVAIALSLQQVVVATLGPWVGRRVAEHSIRTLMLWGTLLLSAGALVVSQSESIWHLYLGYSLIVGAGISMAGPLPNSALLANWFVRKRGTALGVSQFGVTVSGTLMVPLATWLIATADWRTAMIVFAVFPVALLAPVIRWIVVNRPEDLDQLPDGDRHPVDHETVVPNAAGTDSSQEWTLRRAASDRRVLLLALVVGMNFMPMSAILQVLHSHITDAGLSGAAAAQIVAIVTLAGAIAKPMSGILADRINPRAVMGMSTGLQACGVALIIQADGVPLLMAGGAIFGLGYGGVLPLWGVLLGVLFGREDFGRVMGLMGPIMLPFQMLGVPFATWVFDRYGSYSPAFVACLGCYAVAAVGLAAMRVPRTARLPLATSSS
jgi:MFS family permease